VCAHRRSIGADLRPAGAELGRVEAHRDDRVRALAFVIPFSSPPTIDFRPAPIWEPMLRERTVNPITSPNTSSTA
jgi:hypothetical protein